MKTNAIIRIVIWSLVLAILISVLGTGLLLRSRPSSAASSFLSDGFTGSSDRILLSPAEVQEIDIEWVAGNIVIKVADVDTIQVSDAYSAMSKHEMRWKLEDRKLSLRFGEKNAIGFGFNYGNTVSKDLTILVPWGWECDSLKVDAASATLNVTNLVIGEMDFNGASGSCNFETCHIDKLDLDTASGDIYFTGSLTTLDCDAVSASVSAVFYDIPRQIDMDSMSGDLDISLPSHAGFTVDMDALSGDFICEFDYAQNQDGSYTHGDGKCRITLDAMNGDLYIREHKSAEAAPETR